MSWGVLPWVYPVWDSLGFLDLGNYFLPPYGNPLQYSCLESPMDGGAWKAAVRGVARSQTRLSDFTFTLHFHALEKEMATHSRVLAWRIPGTGEPGELLSLGSHRVGHDWSDLAAILGKFSTFLMVFLFVFFFWGSYDSNVGAFNIVLEVSEIVLISFNSFFFFPLWFIYFYNSIFYFNNPIFCLPYSTICSVQSLFFSFIAWFVIYWLFFISSRSLLNLSCIFSILVSRLFICDSIFISRFWIIFTIIIQNSLLGRFPISSSSSSFVWFGVHLSCSFTCWVFLYLFILFLLLCLGWPFCILAVCLVLYCGVSLLWVGLYGWLVNVSWLGKLVSVFWWVELDFFSLEYNEVSSNEFWDI